MATVDALCVLDFETYYSADYTLSKSSTEAYVRDPQFEVIGVGVKVGADAAWMEAEEFRAWSKKVDWSRTAALAHHAQFDAFILSHHFGIHPAFMFDTLSMSRVVIPIDAGGSLKKLAEFFEVGRKGDEVFLAKGMRRRDFDDEDYAKYGNYCLSDCDLTEAIFWKLVEGFPEEELILIDQTIRMFTNPQFEIDEAMLTAFLVDERKRKAALLERILQDKSVLMSNEKFAELLRDWEVEPPLKVSAAKSKKAGKPVQTYAFAKTDVGMQELLEHEDENIRWIAEARVGIKSTINETRAERFLSTGRRGKFPVYLRYAAAHTFRFGGGDRTNMQNLVRGGALRGSLLAPKGKKVVAVDSGQIEARVLAWLAGHENLIEIFASGKDIYNEFGAEVFGRPIDRKNDPEDKIPGHISKAMVLGLGYSLGWFKFASEMSKGMLNGPRVQFDLEWVDRLGVDLSKFVNDDAKVERVKNMPSRLGLEDRVVHCAVAEWFVRRYRNQNKPITEFWSLMDAVLKAMLQEDTDFPVGANDCLRVVRHGIQLPNGLTMRYPGLRESDDGEGYSYMGGRVGKDRVRAYGGSLTENVVQALSRVIVFQQALKLREMGYQPVTSTHDELVYIVDDGKAEKCLDDALTVMKTAPSWAMGLPLSADGGIGKSYGECK